jgi:hypothetical protein
MAPSAEISSPVSAARGDLQRSTARQLDPIVPSMNRTHGIVVSKTIAKYTDGVETQGSGLEFNADRD